MARTLIGTRIREGRRAKGLTQAKLAADVGISAPYLNLIEHNRRGIAGKTLAALADALDLPMRDLSEGADQTLLDRLQEAAKSDPSVRTETIQLEEFVGRFPGWARLIKRLQDRADHHADELAALSDQMNRDPFFSEAMHLMLSNITALRSTVEILADETDLPAELAHRFMTNLREQAVKLSDTAQDIQEHFDSVSKDQTASDTSSPNEAYWEERDYFDPALENGKELVAAGDPRLSRDLEDYFKAANNISSNDILRLAPELNFDPLKISRVTNTPLPLVFRRLAHLPHLPDFPEFGLMICDQAGGVLFRKPLPALALPRRSGGCPLWPIYRAAQRPDQPIRARIVMPSGEELLTYSVASFDGAIDFNLPPRMTLSMLFISMSDIEVPKSERDQLPLIEVGAQCSICPRQSCEARRDRFILG